MKRSSSTTRLVALGLGLAAVLAAGAAGAQYREYRPYPPPAAESRYGDIRGGANDAYVQRRVEGALYRTLGRVARGIAVRVEYGNVYLSGVVRDQRDRRAARDVAADVRGVRQVYARRLRVAYY